MRQHHLVDKLCNDNGSQRHQFNVHGLKIKSLSMKCRQIFRVVVVGWEEAETYL